MEMGRGGGRLHAIVSQMAGKSMCKNVQDKVCRNNPRKNKKRCRHASYPAIIYFITKTIHESRAIFMKKNKCSCLIHDLIFKISPYFQIKGRNSVVFDKIKQFAIP